MNLRHPVQYVYWDIGVSICTLKKLIEILGDVIRFS